jgi:hypothetical protein
LFLFCKVREPYEFSFAGVQFESHRCTPGLYVSEALSEFDLCVFDVAYGKFYVELSIIGIDVDENTMAPGDVRDI